MDHKNKGVLFTNDKGDNDKRPDLKGKGNWNGKEFEVAAWHRVSKDGKKYISLSFSEPWSKEESGGGWEQAREKFEAKKADVVPTEVSDDEVDLSEIPF
jgi:uncharacterized protein (DUF736 family)